MKTLLIDVDGTLIDSYPGIRASFLHTLDAMGHPHPGEDILSRIAGPPMEQTMRAVGMTPDEAHQAVEIYLRHYGEGSWANAEPYPGMRELLARWKEKGFQVCTATSKGEHFARQSLELYGMIDFIDFLGAAEENGPRRSKESVIAHVLDSLALRGTQPDILMIGDRIHDFDGAATFGIDAVACAWGYGDADEHAKARWTATNTRHLEDIVDEWNEQS
ncbi:HAD-IA family hydrolase [Corynebacterium sp. CCM 9185]|uniref:HAD-IA family hydrolase n=1 Tax=Corynebacterium marambiense TaxID=2765364 RepID=A0ABS0VVY1_9CORY|nr:HAD-IA family hydrolase [Corynebacterium marambiense]MCK7662783.1 HAD-IA family hydrolase [Corynebacterium marambiense]